MNRRGPLGICDRCGWAVKYARLRDEYQDSKRTGLLVCPKCWDDDHPQYRVSDVVADDPKPIKDPRPETYTDGLWGWAPVGNPQTYLTASAGTIRVRIG